MPLLDRYIARQYLFNVIVLLILLFSFVVAVDMTLNMHRFTKAAARLAAARGEADAGWGGGEGGVQRLLLTLFLVADMWWPKLLQLFNFVLGLVLVGAMGFTFTQMVRHRELVAALAGGVSLYRLARPILLVALVMTALQVANQEFVIPRVAPLLIRDHGEAGAHDLNAFAVPPTADARGTLFHARRFDPETGTLEGLSIWQRQDRIAVRRIDAERAVWQDGAWRLEHPTVEPLAATDPPLPLPDPVTLAAIETDLDPDALLVRRYDSLRQNLSWRQIASMAASPHLDAAARDGLDRIRYGRVSAILCNFLGLLISIPFFLLREPRNLLAQSLKCAPIAMTALMGGVLAAAAPIPGLPAAFAAFLPVFILIPVAIYMLGLVKT